MIRIIGDQKQRALEWALPIFGLPPMVWKNFSALALEKDGDFQSAVFYKNYHPANSIEMHIAAVAGGRWLTRSFLRAAFQYPFVELGVRSVTGLVAADNFQSQRFVEHLGFVLEGCKREGWAEGIDALIYGMLRRECRYLGEKVEPKTRHTDAAGPERRGGSANVLEQGHRDSEREPQPRRYDNALWRPDLQQCRNERRWHAKDHGERYSKPG